MRGPGLCWQLENIGYRLFLDGDLSLQDAFGKVLGFAKNRGEDLSYREKLLLLLRLMRRMKRGASLEEIRERTRLPVSEEWKAGALPIISCLDEAARGPGPLVIKVRDLLVIPVLNSPEQEELFRREEDRQGLRSAELFLINEDAAQWILDHAPEKQIFLDVHPEDALLKEFLDEHGFLRVCDLYQGEEPCAHVTGGISDAHLAGAMMPRLSPVLQLREALMENRFLASGKAYSPLYAAGYQYGGLVCMGFCQWLHRIKREEKIDRLLFCSRDCDVIRQVYERMYPEDSVVYFRYSRRAMGEVFFEEEQASFLDAVFLPVVRNRRSHITVADAFKRLGICIPEEELAHAGLLPGDTLTPETYRILRDRLPSLPGRLQSRYAPAREAGLLYLDELTDGRKKVCVADLGWHGTALRHVRLYAQLRGDRTQVTGVLMAGTKTPLSAIWQDMGILQTYLFEDGINRAGSGFGRPLGREQVRCLEMLFSSPEPSLLHYGLRDGNTPDFVFGKSNPFRDAAREIQRGILDFSLSMLPHMRAGDLRISREEAWTVLRDLLDSPERTGSFLGLVREAKTKEGQR